MECLDVDPLVMKALEVRRALGHEYGCQCSVCVPLAELLGAMAYGSIEDERSKLHDRLRAQLPYPCEKRLDGATATITSVGVVRILPARKERGGTRAVARRAKPRRAVVAEC